MWRFLWVIILGLLTSMTSYSFDFDVAFSVPQNLSEQKGLVRVLWWNVQFGETNRRIRKSNPQKSPLDQNLQELIRSPFTPDVICLGEFSDDSIDQSTLDLLKKKYPYFPDKFWPYNPDTPERGLIVFSKYPLRQVRQALLDYYPLSLSSTEEIKRYKAEWAKDFPPERFFPRTYINLEIDHPAGKVHVIPFHALVHVEKQFRESGGGFWSILRIKLSLGFGSENPMIYQLRRLREELAKDFGDSLVKRPFVILGDFNLPRKIFGMRTKAYAVVSKDLVDAFEDNEVPSWPMPSSKEFEEISIRAQIDHAFCSETLTPTNTVILPFKGSDHAAILVGLRPRQ